MKIRATIINENRMDQLFVFKYAWGCMLYSSQWLSIIALSSYVEGLVEIVYDRNDAIRNGGIGSECDSQSPILLSAVSKNLESLLCVALLVPFLVTSTKGFLTLNPWFAVLVVAAAIQISDRLEPNVAHTASASVLNASRPRSQCYTYQLSCPLKDRSVAILIGALCAIHVSREVYLYPERQRVIGKVDSEDGMVDIDVRNPHHKRSAFSRLRGHILTILSLIYLFFPITTNTLISPESDCQNDHKRLFQILDDFLFLIAWAFLMVTIISRHSHCFCSRWLRALLLSGIWDSFSRFLYPLIFILRYEVLEHIVKNRFGFLSVSQFLGFIFCVYLVGYKNKE